MPVIEVNCRKVKLMPEVEALQAVTYQRKIYSLIRMVIHYLMKSLTKRILRA
jgi:hypothetical protein